MKKSWITNSNLGSFTWVFYNMNPTNIDILFKLGIQLVAMYHSDINNFIRQKIHEIGKLRLEFDYHIEFSGEIINNI